MPPQPRRSGAFFAPCSRIAAPALCWGAIAKVSGVPSNLRVSPLFLIFALLWVAMLTWRIYPQFKDAIRVEGRLTTVSDYLDEVCGQRVGPAAATCLAETREQARLLLRHEQGKSILLIEAPLLGYLMIYLPVRALARRRRAPLPS
jgi:hypothetical protein